MPCVQRLKRGHPVVRGDVLVEVGIQVPGELAEFSFLPGRDAAATFLVSLRKGGFLDSPS